ncbi:uncharacterized protein LOC18428822 isoform X3 [Amborella trichopoda]|uniref:uncharacterized protein LOC18428822 isoform X3 n=1 Tax=Amborella trichopoda TaxID=13333 RepID=UPI0009C03827|nr:uncharacterized protein LOC18428822 isoform X3 [Amborella trichopoda]|eukprot:XP_020519641.1 uncharacterized protein LOC18428822 isoform X3 [Amborella trichopoda]
MKKGKGVQVRSPPPPPPPPPPHHSPTVDFDHNDDDFPLPTARFASRNASSKYDFVKVRVWLGDNADHYYVLSRFLLSRMLTVTKIPNHVAIKIALELKKLLIDNSLLDVSQSDLEANLFKLMERRGYGEEYINRYKMMTRFHHQRVPLVVLVCGTACSGKSTIATQLAQRLNLPNVLQTDMVYELLRTSTDAPLTSTPVWARDFESSEELVTEFCRECRIVRKGLAGDLKKAMKDGKPIIIEGIHLDPSIYLMDEENQEINVNTNGNCANNVSEDISAATNGSVPGVASDVQNVSEAESEKPLPETLRTEGKLSDQVSEVMGNLESLEIVENSFECQGFVADTARVQESKTEKSGKNGKPAAEPVIIPIVLKMADFDHKALLEEWISARTFGDKGLAQGMTVVNISATTFPQTLDWLHGYLLQRIEQGISHASSDRNPVSEAH